MDNWATVIKTRHTEYLANCLEIEITLNDIINDLKQPPINLSVSLEKIDEPEIAWKISIGSKHILLTYKEISANYSLRKMNDLNLTYKDYLISFLLEKCIW